MVPLAAAVAVLVASCSSAAGGPTAVPVAGESVVVTLAGGPDAGRRTADGDPNCGFGPLGWGAQLTIADAQPSELSSVQIVVAAAGREEDPNATFPGTKFLLSVVIGPFFAASRRAYEINVRTDPAASLGSGSATVEDSGSSAQIHATGTTADGVAIDVTVFCPYVLRQ